VPVGGLVESGFRVEVGTDPRRSQRADFLGEGSVGVPAGGDAFVELVAVAEPVVSLRDRGCAAVGAGPARWHERGEEPRHVLPR